MSRIRVLATGAALVALAAGLVGCAPEPFEVIEVAPENCLAGAWNNGPDRTTVVPCSVPHIFDAVASLGEWPGTEDAIAAEDSTARLVYERLVLAEEGDVLADAFREWARPRCNTAFSELLGLDAITVDDEDGTALGLRVFAPYTLVASLSSREQFELGDRTVLCAVAWLDADGALSPVEYPRGSTITALVGEGLPLALRECFALADDGTRSDISCSEKHTGQVIVDVDARAALGDSWVSKVDPQTGRSRDYKAADTVCREVIKQLLPEDSLTSNHKIWADIRPIDGWVSFDGTVVDDERYPISCAVIAKKRGATLSGGSLWGEQPLPPTPPPTPSGSASPPVG